MRVERLKISKATIKRIVKESTNAKISDSAAEMLAKMLEKRAESIARHAVQRAKKKSRGVVLLEDVEDYKLNNGD